VSKTQKPKRTEAGPARLEQCAGTLRTRMGTFYPSSHAVFRGHDLHAQLRDMDWLQLYLFGITGRRFDEAQTRLLHAIWVYTSYPDARLWNNRVAALAGTARSTPALGMSAALAVSEATIYGGQAGVRAYDFFFRAQCEIEKGHSWDEVVRDELRKRRIYGYGRPVDSNDERIPWLVGLARELNLGSGPYLRLALDAEQILTSRHKDLRLNYGGLVAAVFLDLGFSREEYALATVPLFFAGMPPCYIEATEKDEGTLFPLSCRNILYEGKATRRWRPDNT
jgi:hypothetical protein